MPYNCSFLCISCLMHQESYWFCLSRSKLCSLGMKRCNPRESRCLMGIHDLLPSCYFPSSPAGSATSSSPSTQVPLANFLVTPFSSHLIEKKTNDLLVLESYKRLMEMEVAEGGRSNHPSSTPSGVAPPLKACRTHQGHPPGVRGLTPLATSWMKVSSLLTWSFLSTA